MKILWLLVVFKQRVDKSYSITFTSATAWGRLADRLL